MAIERAVYDWHGLRSALQELSWGDGLTRDEMLNQSEALRSEPDRKAMRMLPRAYRFPDANSTLSYFEQLDREGQIQLANLPAPAGYSPTSPTGETFPAHRYPPSVGSGYGSGNTGSSAQTGVGREGTSDHEEWT